MFKELLIIILLFPWTPTLIAAKLVYSRYKANKN